MISFGDKNVQFMLSKYAELLKVPHQTNIKTAHVSGLFFGYSQSIRFVYIGFVFFVAAVFVNRYGLDRETVFTGCYVVFVGAIGSGVSLSQMPSVARAKQSAKTVFGIIEEPSEINPNQQGVEPKELTGSIVFRNLYFKYPSRKRHVLRGLNLEIKPNQSVAIVGHSGSGKSTIASLLLRFYDTNRGQVLIDDVDIKDYNLKALREQISIVQQEPLLFNESIKANIQFGDPKAPDQNILSAAIQANALGFIMQNEDDMSKPSVRNKIVNDFCRLTQAAIYASYPKILGLVSMAKRGSLSYRSLMFANAILLQINSEGLRLIESNFETFTKTLEE